MVQSTDCSTALLDLRLAIDTPLHSSLQILYFIDFSLNLLFWKHVPSFFLYDDDSYSQDAGMEDTWHVDTMFTVFSFPKSISFPDILSSRAPGKADMLEGLKSLPNLLDFLNLIHTSINSIST